MPIDDDVDWLRRRLDEIEHRTWARPTGDGTAHAALLDAADGLRTIVGVGDAEQIRALRASWEECTRGGGASATDETIADLIRSASAEVTAARSDPDDEAPTIDEAADLDWARARLVELDDRRRALPATDIAARHALLEATDGLRAILRDGHADRIHAVRKGWEARAGRKGEHELDAEAIAGMVRSMMPSQGR